MKKYETDVWFNVYEYEQNGKRMWCIFDKAYWTEQEARRNAHYKCVRRVKAHISFSVEDDVEVLY